MAVGATLAGALTTPTSRAYSLYVGGLDVLLQPGTGGNRMGTPIETIQMTEAGPGGVSGLDFEILDPGLVVTLSAGQTVQFFDHVQGYPIFLGFVQSWAPRPDLGTGRAIAVNAVGVEAVLDWALTVNDMTFAANSILSLAPAIQAVVSNSTGAGPIRALSGLTVSHQDGPIEDEPAGTGNPYAFTIPSGTTVREAIRLIGTSLVTVLEPGGPGPVIFATVDFYYGLRAWQQSGSGLNKPLDYSNDVVSDVGGSTDAADRIDYTRDAAGVQRAVVVRGTGVLAVVTDGTGLPGAVGRIEDTTLTTAQMAQDAGRAYLAEFAVTVRGSYTFLDKDVNSSRHPGALVTIDDPQLGLSGAQFRIMQIDRSWNPSGRADQTLAYGGLPPSGARLLRRLTRTLLS